MVTKNEQLLEDMKNGIKENPTLKKYLDEIIADGVDEDTALDIMIHAWLHHARRIRE